MNKITVVGTYHTESGACSEIELRKVVTEISPDMIFCEAAPEVFQRMIEATGSFNTPEINLLRKLVENPSIKIVPIDLNNDPFDGRLEAMFELFPRNINDYFYASKIHASEAHRLGFQYLNSHDSDQIHKDKSSMEKTFVAKSNNSQLIETHKNWLKWNDEREYHWIDTINKYSKTSGFNNAVFLVGSAHRIRLMEKVSKLSEKRELILDWNFYPFK